jgi:hypothetical protein
MFLIINDMIIVSFLLGTTNLSLEIINYNSRLIEFKVSYNIGSLDGILHVILLPISFDANFDTTVKIFYDERYPFSWIASHWAWKQLVNTLTIQLQLRGIRSEIINANQFADIVNNRLKCVIVVPNGILPHTVYNGLPYPNNPINQWLISGGVLIWVGDTIGYLIGYEGNNVRKIDLPDGISYVIGRDYGIGVGMSRLDTLTNKKGIFASILGLKYPLVTRGARLDEILKYDGLPLGYLYTDVYNRTYVSISLVPVVNGTGRVIIFGDGYDDFDDAIGVVTVASDIAQIIWSEIIFYKIVKNQARTAFPVYKVYRISETGSIVDKFYLNNDILFQSDEKQNIRFVILAYTEIKLLKTLFRKLLIFPNDFSFEDGNESHP